MLIDIFASLYKDEEKPFFLGGAGALFVPSCSILQSSWKPSPGGSRCFASVRWLIPGRFLMPPYASSNVVLRLYLILAVFPPVILWKTSCSKLVNYMFQMQSDGR